MRQLILPGLCLAVLVPAAQAADTNKVEEAKVVSGMSILGNNDAPKSLTIVPWKTSEIASETRFSSSLDEGLTVVDKPVFQRELDFYQASTP